jgi:hypothetical protein
MHLKQAMAREVLYTKEVREGRRERERWIG